MASTGTILFADDDVAIRDSLCQELLDIGYKVAIASNGSEAIALVKKQHFDLALLDINMPEISGFDVLTFIKQHDPATKVIILTGYADLKNFIKAKKLCHENFGENTIYLLDLLTTIEQVLTG